MGIDVGAVLAVGCGATGVMLKVSLISHQVVRECFYFAII